MNYIPRSQVRPHRDDPDVFADDQPMFENGLPSRQGFLDRPVLAVLIISLLLTVAVGTVVAYSQVH